MLTKKKKILVFTDWYEPGFKAGGPIRSCVNFAQHMQTDCDIFIFTSDRDLGDTSGYPTIKTDVWNKHSFVSIFYVSPSFLKWKTILNETRTINPEYIYVNSMYSRYFSVYPLLMKKLGLIKASLILAPRGMLKSTALKFKRKKKKFFLRLLRLFQIQKGVIFHATDATENNDIKAIFGKEISCVQIPNLPPKQNQIRLLNKLPGELNIIFIGRIHPIKNLNFLLNCLAKLKSNICLTIVATIEDEAIWFECQELINNFPSNIHVIIEKDIPHEQIEDLILRHHIFVLPTLGENFGHAIFEALSVGRPVLISDQTPWRNLQSVKAGWDLSLHNPLAFVDVLKEVAEMNDETFQLWCKGAWQLANDYITKSDLKNQYLKLFS